MSVAGGVLSSTVDLQIESRKREFEQRRRTGASWFFWVAGLSVVNSVILMTGGSWSFIFGLGLTQVVDALFMAGNSTEVATFSVGALVVDATIAAGFALVGYFALQGHTSAFTVGMGLYAVDGVLFVVFGDFFSAAFHLFALWRMWRGLSAHRELGRLAAPSHEPAALTGVPHN